MSGIQEFTWKIRASIKLLKLRNCRWEDSSNFSATPASYALGRDHFLPPKDMRFGSHDYWLQQPEKNLTYARAFQHWAEKTQLPCPCEPHQLAEFVLELCHAVEPLMTFLDKEVLEGAPPSHWQLIMPSKLKVLEQPLCENHHDLNHSKNHWAHIRGTHWMTGNGIWPWTSILAPMGTSEVILPPDVRLKRAATLWPSPPLGFVDIAWSLCKDTAPQVATGIPPELYREESPIQVAGTTLFSTYASLT